MLPKSNIHSHTTYVDGRNTAGEMVQAALALGFHTLGFSEHGHVEYDACSMSPEQEPAYRAEVLRLRADYAGRIAIPLGYEHDWLAPAPDYPYDFVIESVHYLPADGGYWSVDETAKRLVDFAKAISGSDPSKAEDMRKAIDKGFGDATKSWGRELPEISAKTHDRVNELLDDWKKELEQ